MTIRLRPMFSFYGSKWRAAPHYHLPTEKMIIEPFAGSASYAMHHYRDHEIWINDIDETVYGIWKYLQSSTKKDILDLPLNIADTNKWDGPRAAKDLIGFWFTKATPIPATKKVGWARGGKYAVQYWSEGRRKRIADQVEFIRDWEITNFTYGRLSKNLRATWFIDPPYQGLPGRAYKYNNINYADLGLWCKEREGQVIVCENGGADWLKFKPLGEFKTARKGKSKEVVYYQERLTEVK